MPAPSSMPSHAQEIRTGQRFAFGENWARFLQILDDRRIDEAVSSLQRMLQVERLDGLRFLDIGNGSGLFSLAARRLGAKVLSFDYDPQSVACAQELKRRYFPNDADWQIQEGSVLDEGYMQGLGSFDVVYSWGVLHHTGDQWRAIANAEARVAAGGRFFIALYNDQGTPSRWWWAIKKTYVSLPPALRWLVLAPCYVRVWGPPTVKDFLRLRPFQTWRTYKARSRGMSPHRDLVDWVGGFPFEVSKPEEVFDFCRARNHELITLVTCAGGMGCNEFVFLKKS